MSIDRAVVGFWLTWLLTFVAFPTGVDLSYGWAVFGSSGAIVFAAVTGGVLVLLL